MGPGPQAYTQVAAEARREELILNHLPLVRHIVGKLLAHLPQGIDRENLESAAMLGLVEAANKFDPERGIKFETFSYPRIRGAVWDEIRRNCLLPQHVAERVAKVRQVYGTQPAGMTLDNLAAATGLSQDEVTDCLAAMRLSRLLSLEEVAERAEDQLEDHGERPEAEAEQAEQKALLAEAIALLPERERLVVTLYYLEDLRLKEIGRVLNLSESRISRLLAAALFSLGEHLRARGV